MANNFTRICLLSRMIGWLVPHSYSAKMRMRPAEQLRPACPKNGAYYAIRNEFLTALSEDSYGSQPQRALFAIATRVLNMLFPIQVDLQAVIFFALVR